MKGRTWRDFKKSFFNMVNGIGRHPGGVGNFWAIGYGVWIGPPGGTGNITDEMEKYLEHHHGPFNSDSDDVFLE